MKKEKWLLEIKIRDKTYWFEYETREEAELSVETICTAAQGQWIHIQDTYVKNNNVNMVSFREIK